MSYPVPDYQGIKTGILRDIANLLNGAVISEDSDYAVRASGEAAAIEGLYAHQLYILRQIFPDTADVADLEHHAAEHGLTRKPAAYATSPAATFSGSSGSPIPLGTEGKTIAGVAFVTTAAGTVGGGGTVSLPVRAVLGGLAGNVDAGTALTLTAAPSGIATTATLTTATTGGADIETPEALLSRLLFVLQNPPQGGSKDDYKKWALDVPGVGFAYVYGQRTAANAVDIVILDSAGNLPGAGLIAEVQAVIEYHRNVTADCYVLGPTAVAVAVTGALMLASGYLLADVSVAVIAALTTYFHTLKPGDTVYRNRIINLILEVPGVIDVSLSAPAANVTALVDSTHIELCTLGTVTLT
jgi:uncharacterized phage protein gp47/JayE